MGLQKYKVERTGNEQKNGSIACYGDLPGGGATIALVRNCPTPFGPRTVYVIGLTSATEPAACRFRKRIVRGFLLYIEKEGGYIFRPYRGEGSVFPFVSED